MKSKSRYQEVNLLRRLNIRTPRNPRLNHMQIRQVQLLQLLHKIAELRDGILHFHALELRVRTQANASPLSTNSTNNRLCNFDPKACSLLDAAAPSIGTLIGDVLQELVDHVAVRAVDFYAVETSFDCVEGTLSVEFDEVFDFGLCQRSGCETS